MDDRVLVRIRGRVQGVWYRDWTKRKAEELGLRGWVRNRRNGDVEALFIGARGKIQQMIDKCRAGSPLSRVDGVIQVDEETDPEGSAQDIADRFEIRSTH